MQVGELASSVLSRHWGRTYLMPTLSDDEFDHRLAQLHELVAGTRSLSRALAWWTGEGTPTIHILGARERVLYAQEHIYLHGHRHTTGHERVGMLNAPRSGRTLALTRALIIPDRIPRLVRLECGIPHSDHPEVVHATRVPLGIALAAEHGERVRRADQTVRSIVAHEDTAGERLALECTATLLLDDQPVALVAEQLTRAVVEQYRPPGAMAAYLDRERGRRTSTWLRWWDSARRTPWRTAVAGARRRRVG
jgi:hypothetical protein